MNLCNVGVRITMRKVKELEAEARPIRILRSVSHFGNECGPRHDGLTMNGRQDFKWPSEGRRLYSLDFIIGNTRSPSGKHLDHRPVLVVLVTELVEAT